jgi:hypothetical protein
MVEDAHKKKGDSISPISKIESDIHVTPYFWFV